MPAAAQMAAITAPMPAMAPTPSPKPSVSDAKPMLESASPPRYTTTSMTGFDLKRVSRSTCVNSSADRAQIRVREERSEARGRVAADRGGAQVGVHALVVHVHGFELLQIQHDRDRNQQNGRREEDQVIGADLPYDLAREQRTERCTG